MLFGIVTVLLGLLIALTIFNTGQTTAEKMRITNAADAAAYSGALWEARALNFQAYTNRAMVANQVAIAQTISFVSWSKFLETTAENIDTAIGWIPFIKPFTQAIKTAAQLLATAVENSAQLYVALTDKLLPVLSASQRGVHLGAAATSREIMQEVVKRNDPNYELTRVSEGFWANNQRQWINLTKEYSTKDELDRKANVVSDSRDGFTAARNWKRGLPGIPGLLKVELRKAGQTRLSSNDSGPPAWEWKGKDTLSLHLKIRTVTWRGVRWKHWEVPLGWGAGFASSSGKDFDNDGRWSSNRTADSLAENEKVKISGYNGLRRYRDIRDLDNEDPRIGLAVEVSKSGGSVRTSTNTKIGTGRFKQPDKFAGNEISALSKAEVFFARPIRRADGRQEYGNLFNPYWQVRLTEPSRAERLATWGRKGVVGDLGGLF